MMHTLPIRSKKPAAKRAWILTAFLLLATVLWLTSGSEVLATGGNSSSPSVQVQAPNFDFGEVFSGQVITHAFSVRNTGSAALTLSFKDAVTPGTVLLKPASLITTPLSRPRFRVSPAFFGYRVRYVASPAAAAPI
jgi:hypothetical protein